MLNRKKEDNCQVLRNIKELAEYENRRATISPILQILFYF